MVDNSENDQQVRIRIGKALTLKSIELNPRNGKLISETNTREYWLRFTFEPVFTKLIVQVFDITKNDWLDLHKINVPACPVFSAIKKPTKRQRKKAKCGKRRVKKELAENLTKDG